VFGVPWRSRSPPVAAAFATYQLSRAHELRRVLLGDGRRD